MPCTSIGEAAFCHSLSSEAGIGGCRQVQERFSRIGTSSCCSHSACVVGLYVRRQVLALLNEPAYVGLQARQAVHQGKEGL